MNTILQQLYNGEICLIEQYRPILEEYKAIKKSIWTITRASLKNLAALWIRNLLKLWMSNLKLLPLTSSRCSRTVLNWEQK